MSTISIAIAALAAAAAGAPVRFAETCSGSETIKVGDRPMVTTAYRLTFSVDLQRRLYCYDRCTHGETYPIADANADPLSLSDIAISGQTRRLAYSPRRSRLTDDQLILAGPIRVERHAAASCRPAFYRSPPAR